MNLNFKDDFEAVFFYLSLPLEGYLTSILKVDYENEAEVKNIFMLG